ncbi:hypothetical protein [Halorarius litoreus]|uniref:hypothetical protein n=1 Tax=Halorarius litoreus TaxID=2962676 RepID=UPI0020CEC5E8|nr:hypothetical protein [Halorarius litoreus]
MVAVTYHCPRCGSLAELDRDAYLADKCVTPHPLDGWEYASPWEAYEDAEGVEIVCGASETRDEGCGEPYYLSFVQFDAGEERQPHTSVTDATFDFLRR